MIPIVAIVGRLYRRTGLVLATRVTPEGREALRREYPRVEIHERVRWSNLFEWHLEWRYPFRDDVALDGAVVTGPATVERGQWEGARALGMSYRMALQRVIVPQALRRMAGRFERQLRNNPYARAAFEAQIGGREEGAGL